MATQVQVIEEQLDVVVEPHVAADVVEELIDVVVEPHVAADVVEVYLDVVVYPAPYTTSTRRGTPLLIPQKRYVFDLAEKR